jgi:hypothetical protein
LGEHRSRLVALQEDDLRANRNLRFFRRQNGLLRDAYYEESVVKVAGIIMAMFVLESVINGSLFAQVVSTGLIGGAVLAGMISAINILSGIGAGVWGWRHITHRKTPLRILGVFVTLLCHSIAVFWNLFVAHFREVAEEFSARDTLEFDVSQIKDATIGHIHAHGLFGVESLQSWALLLLGLFIHFISAKEGWDDFADRYPDYKKYDLRAKTAHRTFEAALVDLRDDVREAIEEVEEEAEQKIANAKNAYASIAELLDLAHQRRQEVRDSEEEWVAGGNRLLKAYREANLEIRDPGSAPAYFETYPSAADYRRCDFGGDAGSSTEIEERKRSVENSLQELAELRDRAKLTADNSERLLKSIHRHVTSALKNLDQRIHDETVKITDLAEERLIEEGWGAGATEAPRAPA